MMKKILMLLLAALLLVACNSKTEKKDAPAPEQEAMAAEWVEVTLNVEGMTCDGCENAIKAGVETLDGIAAVESSHEEAWTKVKYDKNATSLEEIQTKITETGYEVKGEL
jgi:copper chaperone CopZ